MREGRQDASLQMTRRRMRVTLMVGIAVLTTSVLLVHLEVIPPPRLCKSLYCGENWPPEAAPILGRHFTWAQLAVLAVGVVAFVGSIAIAFIQHLRADGGTST